MRDGTPQKVVSAKVSAGGRPNGDANCIPKSASGKVDRIDRVVQASRARQLGCKRRRKASSNGRIPSVFAVSARRGRNGSAPSGATSVAIREAVLASRFESARLRKNESTFESQCAPTVNPENFG
jgi:hypothetical protein